MESKQQHEYYTSKRQMFIALGVAKTTMDVWIEKEWFPKKRKDGWLKKEVQDAVEKHNADKEPSGETLPGTKEEKTALECKLLKIRIDKERENLTQAQEETRQMVEEGKRKSRLLIEKREVMDGLQDALSLLRSVIESWEKSCIAENPDGHEHYKQAKEKYISVMNETFSAIV